MTMMEDLRGTKELKENVVGFVFFLVKGYSTIAWTPFFLNITIRCTWPYGLQMVCRTSCKEKKKGKKVLVGLVKWL